MAATATPQEGTVRSQKESLFGSWRMRIASLLVAAYVLAAIFGPMLLDYDAVATSTRDRLLPPGSTLSSGDIAWLGTDQVGRDVLAQVFQGARISMTVGVVTLILAGSIGLALGIGSGYFGGKLDGIIMRLADVQLSFPSILLAIFIAAILGPSVINVIITLAVTKWVVFARVARGQTLSIKQRDYVDSARVMGAGTWFIIKRCIAPAAMAPVLVVATVELGLVIIAEASLSFLGLGTPQSSPSWGLTIAQGRDYLGTAWWISTVPGIALAILVISVGTLGDELRDRFDPNMRGLESAT
jgi:peptide/nickel transport system permease protein